MLDATTGQTSGHEIASGVSVFRVVSKAELDDVIADLRPEDVAEAKAWGFSPEVLANLVTPANQNTSWAVYIDGDPVFLFGVSPLVAKTWALWGFGTPRTKEIIRPLSRWGKQKWIPYLYERGDIDRIQVHVPMKSEHSWMWLNWIGLKIDTRLPRFGADAEDFLLLSYDAQRYEHDYRGT